eukprot:417701_1
MSRKPTMLNTSDCKNNNDTEQLQQYCSVNETLSLFVNNDGCDINVEEVKQCSKMQFICNNNVKTCGYLKRFQICFIADQNAQLQNNEETVDIVPILDCFQHLLRNHSNKNDTEYICGVLGSCISNKCIRMTRIRNYRNQSSSQTKLNVMKFFDRNKLDQIHCYFQHNKEIVIPDNITTSNNKFRSKLDHRTSKLDLESYSYSYPFNYWLHCKNITKPCFNGMTYSDLYIHPCPKYKNLEEELREHKVSLNKWLPEAKCYMKTEFVKRIFASCDDYLPSIKHFCDHPSKFGYEHGSVIHIKNICSILIYCGVDTFQYDFSSSYRPNEDKKHDNNMDIFNDIKSRHSKFYHFAKILKETVEVFGTQYIDGNVDRVYHGISGQMIIPGFQCKIFGPLSTTIVKTVAEHFAFGDGLVLELVPSVHLKFFDCRPISDFSWEQEYLFIGGLESLNIQMIWKIDGSNFKMLSYPYEGFIPALRMLDSMSNGNYFSNDVADIHIIKKNNWCDDTSKLKFQPVSPIIKDLVGKFIDYRLSNAKANNLLILLKKLNKSNIDVTYIPRLLDTICNEKECVKINWQSLNEGLLEEVAVDGGYIGYKFVKPQICNNSTKYVDIYKINKLFPNVKNLVIKELGNIECSFLDEILKFIKTTQENTQFSNINCIELAVSNDFEVLTNINGQFEKYTEAFERVTKFEMKWDKIWETNKIIITLDVFD